MKRSSCLRAYLLVSSLLFVSCAGEEWTPGTPSSPPDDVVASTSEAADPAAGPSTIVPDASVIRTEPSPSPKTSPGQEGSRAAALLAATVVDPSFFPVGEVRATYAKARQIPERLQSMYCYCRCKENEQLKHKSLLTCFQDDHAAQCGICLKEAQQAHLDFQDGLPVEVTHKTVDLMFNQGQPPHINSHVH